jgi:hypothetical protein
MLAGIDWPHPFFHDKVPVAGNHFQPGNAAIRIPFDRVRHDEENFGHWRAHDRAVRKESAWTFSVFFSPMRLMV